MTWTVVPTVATGDTITAALWNTYVRDNLAHLRSLLGTVDPTDINMVPVSAATNVAYWQKLPDAALANQKMSQDAPSVLSFSAAMLLKSGAYEVFFQADSPNPSLVGHWHLWQIRHGNYSFYYLTQFAIHQYDSNYSYFRTVVNGVPSAWNRILTNTNYSSIIPANPAVNQVIPGSMFYWTGGSGTIPAGYALDTATLDRFIIGAGSSYGVGATGGSTVHAHTLGAAGITGATAGPSNTQSDIANTTTGATMATPSHTHAVGSLDVVGTSDNAAHLPPYYARLPIIKT